ncbi:GYDIA family GHMP kinase [Confluentibacter flavum]|uniref:GHMP kinase n=1 Tax=Confluentibacter flavum TaxID=1909700 RepID=A0A2N3HG54_9FLAO|nr:GYDIA family GHMP kinase [Confluentibacter flavum]PKQ43874.1 GHMP kinase [Confluentibacter flavum]
MKNDLYYSNGKLLISGEYLVLDGAISLAIPTKYGQSLIVEIIDDRKIIWNSFDEQNHVWFEREFELHADEMLKPVQHDNIAHKIVQILNTAKVLNPAFLKSTNGFKISTILTFPRNWGLGTSSTLINNIAQWAHVDAYMLLEKTFGGSGYDIACAQHNHPICYQLENGNPMVEKVEFNPSFKEHLYFVYLNKKQNSRDGISKYKENRGNIKASIIDINNITTHMVSCKSLEDFDSLILQHELMISNIIKQQPVKTILFHDFNGQIKSLGAWGGDFVMATSKTNPTAYFKAKGFEIVIPYIDMVLKNNP